MSYLFQRDTPTVRITMEGIDDNQFKNEKQFLDWVKDTLLEFMSDNYTELTSVKYEKIQTGGKSKK